MELIDNINGLLGDDLKRTLQPGAHLKVAASCFSMYAFEALKEELEQVDELHFIFTSPTFMAEEVTDKIRKERKEFHIPKLNRERSLYGSEFEIHLRNKLTQRAIARECADWLRRKARFMSNRTQAPMQPFACVEAGGAGDARTVYMPLHGFTAVDLGYQPGNAVSNLVNKLDEPPFTATYLQLFDQIWNDAEKVEDVTAAIVDHIDTVYKENSPESIYFLMLYNIFNEFLGDVDEDVLPNDRTGYQDTLIWQKLFNFQRDAATGIINKLETYSGCILADSVGLGKTFTALAVVKYYELRNKSVLVLCPKKLASWLGLRANGSWRHRWKGAWSTGSGSGHLRAGQWPRSRAPRVQPAGSFRSKSSTRAPTPWSSRTYRSSRMQTVPRLLRLPCRFSGLSTPPSSMARSYSTKWLRRFRTCGRAPGLQKHSLRCRVRNLCFGSSFDTFAL